MVKNIDTVKNQAICGIEAIRNLLLSVPGVGIESVEHEQKLGCGNGMDELITFAHRGDNYAFIVGVVPNSAPRFVRSAVYRLESCVARLHRSGIAHIGRQLIPVLVSPYLSPESRAICLDHDIAYLDLFGNARLVFDTVYIERAVAGKPAAEARALRPLFTPKAAAVLRVLLHEPGRAWRIADLASQAHVSYGHVSNVRKALLMREWIKVGEGGILLVQPDALLQSWRESYRRPPGESIVGYTHLHGRQLDERLRETLNPYSGHPRAICALLSAAQWLAPFGRSATHTFYADESGAEVLKEALQLTHVASGANVALHVPTDETLFHDACEPAPNMFCTNPIVTYLDLWIGSDRDQEAAEHLSEEFFPWLK